MVPSFVDIPPPGAIADVAAEPPTKRRRLDLSSATRGPCDERQIEELSGNDSQQGASPLHTENTLETVGLPPHPLGIRPLGNAGDSGVNIKCMCGYFSRLPDDLLIQLLEHLDFESLLRLGATCKALYAFCRHDELWKALFIESPPLSHSFNWRGSWRRTFLGIHSDVATSISCHDLFSDVLHRPFHCAHLDLAPYTATIPSKNAIPRLSDLSADEYAAGWSDEPFILTEPVKSWSIYRDWSVDALAKKHGETVFRAEAVDWTMNTYIDYMRNNSDESPLYLFDCHFAEKMQLNLPLSASSDVANEQGNEQRNEQLPPYTPPSTFHPDLFTILGTTRPHHRWLILGPRGSGSTFHADPNGTSAWNAVLRGSKYWLMFPPPTTIFPRHTKPHNERRAKAEVEEAEAATSNIFPGIHLAPDLSHIAAPLSLAEYLLSFHSHARRASAAGVREAICREGELLHVPAGWYHMVVNLEEGVAVTQNFVSAPGLARCLEFLRDRRDQVSGFGEDADAEGKGKEGEEGKEFEMFVSKLRETHPETLDRALAELEARDAARERRSRKVSRWEKITGLHVASGTERTATNGDAVAVGEEDGTSMGTSGFCFGFELDDVDDEPSVSDKEASSK